MAWMKAPQSLVDLFAESLPEDPAVERRKMFGYPAAFVHGKMFAGVFQDHVFARLSPVEQSALEAAHGPLPFEPMAGRPMKGYVRAPEPVLADEAALAAFLRRGLAYTAGLPPKEKKAKTPKG
jgi:TfoX/Sxy family transcriptional regulator of competence genes